MIVDIGYVEKFPLKVIDTNIRPDIFIYSEKTMKVIMLELIVPLEGNMYEAKEIKA